MMIDDLSFRSAVFAFGMGALIAAAFCWWMQFRRPTSSKHPRR
jgi:hypothetical protein